jgi:hypothetical protein
MSVSKMILTGAAAAERTMVKARIKEARSWREGRRPKTEGRKKAEVRRPKGEAG